MDRLSALLQEAGRGKHEACSSCVWNPSRIGAMAFGTSCAEHTHAQDRPALAVSLARDPGGTTPERTSRLCPVHNSFSDQSAAHGFDLWRAAISMSPQTHPYFDPLMRRTYFTNAILHGVPTRDSRSGEERQRLKRLLNRALAACADVLRAQLTLLQPKVIMVFGESAEQALSYIAPGHWSDRTAAVPAQRQFVLPHVGHVITAYRLIHGSPQSTNLVAAPLARQFFATTQLQTEFVRSRIDSLPSPREALNVLDKYRAKSSTDTTFQGMLLHLAWWIEVGRALRAAAESS